MKHANANRFQIAHPIRWLLPLALLLLWFGTLQYRALIHPDEGRYAEIAREMAVSGDFTTPRLNAIKYFEKPALQYWATAIAFNAFGEHEWTARFWPALCGFIGLIMTAFTAARLWGERSGWLAGAILAGSFWWIGNGHFNTLDMGVSCWMTVCLCGMLLSQADTTPDSQRRGWMLLSWAAMGLAMLSKGLIGIVLPGAVLVLYTLIQRDWRLWTRLELLRGLAVLALVAAPWFILVSRANPEFAHFFFIHEHFERWATTEHRREGAWWYFFPILFVGFMPWISLLPQALWRGMKSNFGGFSAERMLLIWAVFIFAFFSKSGSKLPSYILPIFPALAMLAAQAITQSRAHGLRWHALTPILFGATLICVSMFVLPGKGDESTPQAVYLAFSQWVLIAGGCLVVLGALSVWLAHRHLADHAVIVMSLAMLLGGQLAMLGHNAFNRLQSGKQMSAAIAQTDPAGTLPVFAVRYYDQTVPFYLKRTMRFVDFADEFEFGMKQESDKAALTMDAFKTRWQAAEPAIAIMSRDDAVVLRKDGLTLSPIYEDERRIAVRNH
ncbi:glycosyltransferase family 39 protein [Burkholderiaceae bacterium DAT-1]|nr:glycosyltransferase family 39 protein [Burkholderiaceae bacterium DAT-1]